MKRVIWRGKENKTQSKDEIEFTSGWLANSKENKPFWKFW
jgi:hypothetical protein